LLKCYTFEQMRIPLAVVAPDVVTGEAVIFRDRGDVVLPLRASSRCTCRCKAPRPPPPICSM
jgi:predicted acylesterase/phospholipase RssA